MEIEYQLTEADVLALTQYRLRHVRGQRNPVLMRRLAYLGGFTLLALGALLLLRDTVLPVVFLALAIISFALYPTYFDWLIRRKVSATYRDPKKGATFAPRTLRATGEGLEEKSSLGEIKLKWEVVDDVAETSTYAFISVQQVPLMVVPKDRITGGNYQGFVNACRENMRRSAA